MRMRMYQTYDVVSRSCVGMIFVERADQPAIRAFQMGCENPESMMGKYPKDYELLCIGEIDDSSGEILLGGGDFPQRVVTGFDIVKERERA